MSALSAIPVKDFMTKSVLALQTGATVAEAYDMMKNHRIRHLPVVDKNGSLIGVFTERDLHHAYAPRETDAGWYYDKDELARLSLNHFMTQDPVCLGPDQSFKEAVEIFTRNRFGCLPVVDKNRKLVGILSYLDILKTIEKYL
jgi:CBS domain-containing protein